MKYNPVGDCCDIPVSAAINVAHSQSEVEIGRKIKAYQRDKNRLWDLVTIGGELRLRNFEKEEVEVPINGKPIEASHDGELTMDSTRLKLLERSGRASWTVRIKPDSSLKLQHKYSDLCRNSNCYSFRTKHPLSSARREGKVCSVAGYFLPLLRTRILMLRKATAAP